MFARVLTMCLTHSMYYVIHANTSAFIVEGNWNMILVANDSNAHMTVLDLLYTESVANTSNARHHIIALVRR